MKVKLIYFTLLSLLTYCNDNKQLQTIPEEKTRKIDELEFKVHFAILDSVALSNPHDTIYKCCDTSIKFMEENTGIESCSEGTYVGILDYEFSKNNLLMWYRWFVKNCDK